MKSHASLVAAFFACAAGFVVVAGVAGVTLGASSCIVDKHGGCSTDTDCVGGAVCSAGACVQCRDSSTCGADSFCCQGTCHPGSDVDTLCGCGPAPTDAPGQACASTSTPDGLCLVGATTAVASNVSSGTCGCGCTPDKGGPNCAAPATPGDPPVCQCVENVDCRKQTEDSHGVPHQAADTCAPPPLSSCVCFNAQPQTVCDPNGASPDCSQNGCQNLSTDPHNCGVGGNDCTVDATGIAGSGTCINGGCTCDAATDCTGNTDSCEIITVAPNQCVCDGYRVPDANGLRAACPLELECTAQGCVFDGTAHATEKDLLTALGLPAPPASP